MAHTGTEMIAPFTIPSLTKPILIKLDSILSSIVSLSWITSLPITATVIPPNNPTPPTIANNGNTIISTPLKSLLNESV